MVPAGRIPVNHQVLMFPRLRLLKHARPSADRPPQATLRMGPIEACLWALGYLAAQTLVLCLFLLVMILFAFGGLPSRDRLLEVALALNLETSLMLTAVTSLGVLFVLLPAVRLRTGRQVRDRLWIRRPESAQLILALGAVVPLAILSNTIYAGGLEGWAWLAHFWPELLPVSGFESMELVRGQVSHVSFFVAVVVLALGPAVGEELVFRGIIGQGLIRGRGLVTGVAISSLLFAAVHLFPPHALATIPLALFFHFAYLTTRSFWVPVALHFCNNALAVMLLKYPEVRQLPDSPVVLVCSLMYLCVVTALLWNRRAGRTECTTTPNVPLPRWMLLTGSGCILGFTTAFVWNVMSAT